MIRVIPPAHLSESEKANWCLDVCQMAFSEARQLAGLHVMWLLVIIAVCWKFLADLLAQPVWLSIMCFPLIVNLSPHISRWTGRFVAKVSVYFLILILILFGFLCTFLNIWLSSPESLLGLRELAGGTSWMAGALSLIIGTSWLISFRTFTKNVLYLLVPIFCIWWGTYATTLLIFIFI